MSERYGILAEFEGPGELELEPLSLLCSMAYKNDTRVQMKQENIGSSTS
jgi:hypothetical protein